MKTIYERFIKRTLLSILIIHFSILGFATTYYVSSTGNDSNSGLSTSLAWKTLAKVNAATFKAGDQILFQKGDTFYGSLTITESGSKGSPITFGAYGTGANPVITGFTTVTTWTNLGSNIWESTNAVSTLSTCRLVTVGNINTGIGRFPNADASDGGYLTYQSHSGTSSITSSSLSGTPNWTGAKVTIKVNNSQMRTIPITSQSGGTLTFTAIGPTPNDGYGFFIQDDVRTLDQQNEWYYSPTTKKISIYSTIQPVNVRVSSVDNLCFVSGSYITVENLSFTGANNHSVYSTSESMHHFVIQNSAISFSGVNAIQFRCNYLTIENNIIANSNNSGIQIPFCKRVVIRNNIIENNGFHGGTSDNSEIFNGINLYRNVNTLVEYNRIINSGYNGINFYGDSITIKNNFIDTFCTIVDDGGGIYTYTGGDTKPVIPKVHGNIVLNGIGNITGSTSTMGQAAGIYLDDGSANFEVYDNTVSGCVNAGILTKSGNTNIHNNTCFDNDVWQAVFFYNATGITGNQTNDNKFICKSSTQLAVEFDWRVNDFTSVGTLTNNYYARPIADTDVIRQWQIGSSASNITISAWKTLSGQDANSNKSPQAITTVNDLKFEYNASKSAKSVSLSQSMIDMKGTKYSTSVTLQPYTSVVLMKDNNPIIGSVSSTEYKSICEGTDYNSWTTTGTYTRTLISVLGGDSIVTTNLTVNHKYSVTENITINEGESYQGWKTSGTYSRTLSSVAGCDSIVTTNLTVTGLIIKQGSIPTHFIPVWLGENGINHMNLMVVSATLEDHLLSPDDEIAVFSGSNCVGAVKLTQPIDAADNTSYLTISASQNDGTNNGYIDNDTIIFKIWDNQNQKEMLTKMISYKNDISTWLTTGRYSAGATSVVEITSFAEYTQTIALLKGYNMISTYVSASDPNVTAITKALHDQGDLIKVQDEAGNSYEDWGSYGGWINKLGSFEKTEGYKIKVADNCTLQVTGRPISLPLDIPLKSGWNIISFPRTDLVDAMNIVQSLIDQNKLIKVQDEAGNSIEDWGIFGGWKNGIGNFVPGKAYKVKMNADAVLTIQENYLKSAVILASAEETEYFSTSFEGNGTDHLNINIVGLREAGLSDGDELAAFDGDVCVGSLKITANHLTNGSVALVASASTGDTDPDGFNEGDLIQVYAWNKLTGEESQVQMEIITGKPTYTKNASVLVKVKSLTTAVKSLEDVVSIDVFPNPSQGKVTVRFSTMPDSGSRIDILDITGRKVASRMVTGTSEAFSLDQQPSGLYLVKTMVDSNEIIHKLILNK